MVDRNGFDSLDAGFENHHAVIAQGPGIARALMFLGVARVERSETRDSPDVASLHPGYALTSFPNPKFMPMLSAEQNELITRVGPTRSAGILLRRYWQPAALVEELCGNRPVKPVRLLGEDLVIFRDQEGRYGLIERACPHRGTDLAFGRLEGGGLRCAFHGWLFDVNGRCLETPAEPQESRLAANIRQKAYRVHEKSGILFAYMGPGEPPEFPNLDCFVAPESHTFAFKGMIDCNWLQSLEVGIDPAHTSFLHRFFHDEDSSQSYGKLFRDKSIDSDLPMSRIMREYPRPQIEVEPTDYGMRVITLRRISPEQTHVRVTNLVFPQAFVIPMSSEMTITQWHVPIDDVRHYWYAIFTSFGAPVNKDEMRRQRLALYELPDYAPRKNRGNNYGFDAEEQATRTFTGMGADINVHDQWACESMGAIQDRTREHLGQSDKAISAYRRLLRSAIEDASAGRVPLMVLDRASAAKITGPAAIDGIGPSDEWQGYWRATDASRRRASSWVEHTVERSSDD
jgi:phenylpropionate dioxygenase-like ring-hydroxylating dioxygenase large terminal subunit